MACLSKWGMLCVVVLLASPAGCETAYSNCMDVCERCPRWPRGVDCTPKCTDGEDHATQAGCHSEWADRNDCEEDGDGCSASCLDEIEAYQACLQR